MTIRSMVAAVTLFAGFVSFAKEVTVGGYTWEYFVTDATSKSVRIFSVDPSVIEAAPTPQAGESIGALPAKTVPGLWYQASWGSDLGCLTQGAKVQATGDSLYLGVIKQTGGCGFYKVSVSEK